MIQSEKKLYIRETQTRPNTYASLVLCIMLAVVAVSWVLNEIGLFHVGKLEMRVGAISALLAGGIPIICFRLNKKLIEHPNAKYYLMAAFILVSLLLTTILTFHTTILLLFPLFMGMLYCSKNLGKVALAGSVFCTVASPVLGYVIGAWEVDFFRELICIAANNMPDVIITPGITGESIVKILLYIAFPHLMMVGACAILMFYVIKLGTAHVESRMALSSLSRHDALTGLYNQGVYKSLLEDAKTGSDDYPVGVVFFDVNGLKPLNDSRGHEYGDLLLKRCAKSIAEVCRTDSEYALRLGGDEFLLILENATEADVHTKLAEWQQSLARVNERNREEKLGIVCSMAAGYALGNMKNLRSLVHEADTRMYENKAAYKKAAAQAK